DVEQNMPDGAAEAVDQDVIVLTGFGATVDAGAIAAGVVALADADESVARAAVDVEFGVERSGARFGDDGATVADDAVPDAWSDDGVEGAGGRLGIGCCEVGEFAGEAGSVRTQIDELGAGAGVIGGRVRDRAVEREGVLASVG